MRTECRSDGRKELIMTGKHIYTVEYKMHSADKVRSIDVIATSKGDAWDTATWIAIPNRHNGEYAYSSWVASVKYKSGNTRRFNTFEGNPF